MSPIHPDALKAGLEGCMHPKVQPRFDPEAAKGLGAADIRARWPRFFGNCPDCGSGVIAYASMEHYVAGDW